MGEIQHWPRPGRLPVRHDEVHVSLISRVATVTVQELLAVAAFCLPSRARLLSAKAAIIYLANHGPAIVALA